MEVVKKNEYFTVRMTERGGGRGSGPSALTISKCEASISILEMEASILDTVRYCENVRDSRLLRISRLDILRLGSNEPMYFSI